MSYATLAAFCSIFNIHHLLGGAVSTGKRFSKSLKCLRSLELLKLFFASIQMMPAKILCEAGVLLSQKAQVIGKQSATYPSRSAPAEEQRSSQPCKEIYFNSLLF